MRRQYVQEHETGGDQSPLRHVIGKEMKPRTQQRQGFADVRRQVPAKAAELGIAVAQQILAEKIGIAVGSMRIDQREVRQDDDVHDRARIVQPVRLARRQQHLAALRLHLVHAIVEYRLHQRVANAKVILHRMMVALPRRRRDLAQRHAFDPALCEQNLSREDQPRLGVVAAHRALADLHRCHGVRSEEHTSELQSLMRISYAVFCLKKKKYTKQQKTSIPTYKENKSNI